MCTVKLPEEIAAHFPDFLDYLYAQPSDSKCTINFENWKSMRYLANYFLVPRLTEEVGDFIEEDLKTYDLERIADYVSEFNRDISDDMSRRILPEAAVACAEMILSIEADSKLLSIIPPTMYLKIMRTALSEGEDGEHYVSLEKRVHVKSLLVSYLEESTEVDESTFANYFCERIGPRLGIYLISDDEVNDAVLLSRAEIALRWLRYIEGKGWAKAENHIFYYEKEDGSVFNVTSDEFRIMDMTKDDSEVILGQFLRSNSSSLDMIERIVKEVPSRVVARLIKDVAKYGPEA